MRNLFSKHLYHWRQRGTVYSISSSILSFQFLGSNAQSHLSQLWNLFCCCCCGRNVHSSWVLTPIDRITQDDRSQFVKSFFNTFVIWYYLRSIFIDNEQCKKFSKEFIFLMHFLPSFCLLFEYLSYISKLCVRFRSYWWQDDRCRFKSFAIAYEVRTKFVIFFFHSLFSNVFFTVQL